MSSTTGAVTTDIDTYVLETFVAEDEVLAAIRQDALARGLPQINIYPDEGKILHTLMRTVGARRVVEIGTLFGYSAIWMARALTPDGRLISIEHSPEHKENAERYIDMAGMRERIDVRLGEAAHLLSALATEGPFDACFIDANWDEYLDYLDWSLRHVRPGGLIIAHNANYFGFVGLDPAAPGFADHLAELSPEAAQEYHALDDAGQREFRDALETMRRFNMLMATSPQVTAMYIPSAEGMVVGVVLANEEGSV